MSILEYVGFFGLSVLAVIGALTLVWWLLQEKVE